MASARPPAATVTCASLLQAPDKTPFQPGVPLYQAIPTVLLGFTALPTFRQSISDRYRDRGRQVAVASLVGLARQKRSAHPTMIARTGAFSAKKNPLGILTGVSLSTLPVIAGSSAGAARGPGIRRPLTAALLMVSTALVAAHVGPAWAGDYTAVDEADLRAKITAANADGDATATITLTADIAMTSRFNYPAATKPITIITDGHSIFGLNAPPGSPNDGSQQGGSIGFTGSVIFNNSGILVGGEPDPTTAASGGFGLAVNGAGSSLVNDGTITGGSALASTGGAGGTGAQAIGGANHVNNGTIRGGAGGPTGIGGLGMAISNTAATNNNLIEGGAGGTTSGRGGIGFNFSGTSTLTNNGTIRGGTATNPASTGAHAINASSSGSNTTVTNNGTIEGGFGGAAISTSFLFGVAPNFTIAMTGR